MTLREVIEKFSEAHGAFERRDLVEFIAKTAPNLSRDGLPIRLVNFTTNVKRKLRPEWGRKTYQDRGYNLLYRNPTSGRYTRYLKGIHPEPLIP